ncbi:MAG TPA: hypothetical protein VHG93_14590 [Longimicrobium sp.]|nr:hypothetical protein [Longimicrobium sp.]
MNKLKLDVESLGVETFATAPEPAQEEMKYEFISRRSCIEQCTTSCTI